MPRKPYGLFCPVSKACEELEPRWTIQILGELWDGSTRFNEIRRGVPGISTGLLSKRLKEMQAKGLVERVEDPATGAIDYFRTKKAEELDDILVALGHWAQKNIKAEIALEDRDASTLMWTLRKKILDEELPKKRNVLRFNFGDALPPCSTYWLITKPGEPAEICVSDPGFDIDLFIETDVTVMSGIYLGRRRLAREIEDGRLFLSGDARIAKTMDRWLKLSVYAETDGIALA
ncbi:winged helix-turn-helix transcriptional regulator [Nioella aestuarii]|uniref:winged helix-turn-helix transcriptional regulator n=1 Tax=Nioella aestuarii TaxID=1662864 RepID=UPI003D7F2E78